LKQPQIVTHLDGKRNSLMAVNYATMNVLNYRVITKVWTDGQQGEYDDYFADHCDGVQVTIGNKFVSTGDGITSSSTDAGADKNTNGAARFFLSSLTSTEKALLKTCLGDSDFDKTNNKDVYNWDWGYDKTQGWDHPLRFPHLIKLVRSVTTYTDGGYYAALYYVETDNLDSLGSGGTFYLLNPFSPPDAFATDSYEVYTTKGVLALTSNNIAAYFSFGAKTVYTVDPRLDPTKNPASTTQTYSMAGCKLTTKSSTITSCTGGPTSGTYYVSGQGIAANTYTTSVSASSITISPSVAGGDGTSSITLTLTPAPTNGDLSCEGVGGLGASLFNENKKAVWENVNVKPTPTVTNTFYNCLNKTDVITFLNPDLPATNPPHINLYSVQRLAKSVPRWSNYARWGQANSAVLDTKYDPGADLTYMTNTIKLDLSTNWAVSPGGVDLSTSSEAENTFFRVYKFFPAPASSYNYVAPCSNRGTCDTTTGLCQCFPGYTNDDCHVQSSLSL
jgi:hypothetical protein